MDAEALVGITLGSCTLQKVIGQGKMGAMFLAQQSHPNRQVVVNVVLPMLSLTPAQRAVFRERFNREIDAIASLEHPNIMPIYEYGEYADLAYLVIPYINSGTLSDEMVREGPLPLQKVGLYLEQIAAALDYAHSHGLVHSAIKPANIFLWREGRLLLTNFRLMNFIFQDNSPALLPDGVGAPAETPDYMAPEQILGNSIDARTDQYALGVILYQMVTGVLPFKSDVRMQMEWQHLYTAPPSPHLLRPDLPIAVEEVMLKALAKRPDDRYTCVYNFAYAFFQALKASTAFSMGSGATFADHQFTDPAISTPSNTSEPVIHTPRPSADNQGSNVPTDKLSAVNPVAPPPNMSKRQDRSDIIGRTSMTLLSMSGFVSPSSSPLPASQEGDQSNSEKEITAPLAMEREDVQTPYPESGVGKEVVTHQPRPQEAIKMETPAWPIDRVMSGGEQARSPASFSATGGGVHGFSPGASEAPVRPVLLLQHQPTGSQPATSTKRRRLWVPILVLLLVILAFGSFAYIYNTMILQKNEVIPSRGRIGSNTGGGIVAPSKGGIGNDNKGSNAGPGTRSFQIGTHPLLVIKGRGGNMNIHSGSAGSIIVKAQKNGSNAGVDTGDLGIQYDQSRDGQGRDSISITTAPFDGNINYDITTPNDTQVQVEVSSGSVTVNGVSGLTIDTNGGNLDIENVQGPMNVHTENGDITVRNVKGQMTIAGGNGSIRMDNVNGQLKAVTRNGDVIVRGATLSGQSVLQTNSGSVRFGGALDPGGTYTMQTINGDIDLTLPAGAAFHLQARTNSGGVHNGFGGNSVGSAPQAQITATIGSGGSIIVTKSV